MNYRSKIFIYAGVYSILALLLGKLMFSNYVNSAAGLNVLPINFFQFLLFGLAVITLLITLLTSFILVKRSKQELSFKKRFNLLIPCFIGLLIIFFLITGDYIHLIAPVSMMLYGLILLNLNRFVTSRLLRLGITILIIGIAAIFLQKWHWELLILVFGILPVAFGILIRIKPSSHR
ncbi:hypothetical protein [Lutimonas sp.]|uniref:hypothetical protein n=1 Tax=Lutimonas sp. TaxID=1872403 RepID=UPI003D9AC008